MRSRNGRPFAHEEDREEAREEVQEASERPQDMREGKTVLETNLFQAQRYLFYYKTFNL